MYIMIKYIIKFKDRIYINFRQKINKLLTYAILWILAVIVATYLAFYGYGRVITWYDYFFGLLLYIFSTLAYIIYIFWWLFHNYSLGLKGEVKWSINKLEESSVWKYKLTANKRNRCYEEEGTIEKVEENKRFIIITTDTNREHIIIKKKLTEEEVKFLQQIKKELNEKQRENNEISNT